MTTVYVGGEQHVLVLSLHADELVVQQQLSVGASPSFLCFAESQSRAYAAVEGDDSVASFEVQADGKLALLGMTACPGGPAYVSLDRTEKWLFSASYGSGETRIYAVDQAGVLESYHQTVATGRFSHAALVDRKNERLYVPSKGTDRINVLDFDVSRGRLESTTPLATHAGAGPRHMTFSSDSQRAYVVDENDCTLLVFENTAAGFVLRQTLSTLPRPFAAGDSGADLHLSADERFLYVSNRGHDSLALFGCEPRGVSFLGTTPTGGRVPRNFCLLGPERLLVANQESHSLALFGRDRASGGLSLLGQHQLDERIFWVGSPSRSSR